MVVWLFGQLIQRTSSSSANALFTDRWKEGLVWYRWGQVRKILQHLTWLLFTLGQCLLASTSRPLDCGWWNETTLGSLSEALLDGHVGEGAWELLDDPHVYLRAERDVQEEKLRTRLEEFLQRGSTHQPCTCQLDKSPGMRRQRKRCAVQNTQHEQRNRATYYRYDQI